MSRLKQVQKLIPWLILPFAVGGQAAPRQSSLSSVQFDTPVHVHNSGAWSTNRPQIATAGTNVYLTWFDSGDGLRVLLSRSLDNGKTFSPPRIISGDLQRSYSPEIMAVHNYVYVTWFDGAFGEVYFSFSEDEGETFSEPTRLSGVRGSDPRMAVSGNSVYIAWQGSEPGFRLAISRDNGTTFNEPTLLPYGLLGQFAVVGEGVYVVVNCQSFQDLAEDLCLTVSEDGGKIFSEPVPVSRSPSLRSIDPKLSVVGSNVYVVWLEQKLQAEPQPDIYFAVSRDRGASFRDPVNISNIAPLPPWAHALEPCLAASENNVYIAWIENRPGLFFSRSNDGGITFTNPVNLTESLQAQNTHSCRAAASGNSFYLAWYSLVSGRGNVFFTFSPDNGRTFEDILNLSNDGRTSAPGSLVVAGADVYTAWAVYADTGRGPNDPPFSLRGASDIFLSRGRPSIESTPEDQEFFFAQVADGVSPDHFWKTRFVLMNNSTLPSPVAIQFYAPDGGPLNVMIDNDTRSLFTVTIPGRGLLRLETSGRGELKTGWAALRSSRTMNVLESFRLYDTAQNLLGETVVGASPRVSPGSDKELMLFVNTTGNQNTGIAFVSQGVGEVRFKLMDKAGNAIARKSMNSPFGAQGSWHRAMFITELFGDYPGITEFEGSVIISRAVTAMGLRATDLNFRSIPVYVVDGN